MRTFVPAAALSLTTLFASCQSTPPPEVPVWLEPSPRLAEQIEAHAKRLPWSHGQERVELIHWFAAVGEPAYPQLLELCLDERPDVAGSAVAALGATGDSRLVDAMHALQWPMSIHPQVEFERARAYLRLGDWSELGLLVDGLEAEDLWTRAWCAQALQEVTHRNFEFDPKGTPDMRQAAVGRWREWIDARRTEGLLNLEG